MIKVAGGALLPLDDQGIEAMSKIKLGQGVTVTIKRARNPAFHRKLFALFNLAFDAWEPQDKEYKGLKVAKNFDQFRNDITVMAGYYETAVTFNGDVRLVARSISFANMSQDDFDGLYSAVINVVLARILTQYTRDDLDNVVNQVLGFC